MNTDYKEIKKGIKRAEFDELKYQGNVIWSIIAGVVVGCIAKNFIAGFVVFLVIGIISARKYFELGNK